MIDIAHAAIWIDGPTARILQFEDQRFPLRCFPKVVELDASGAAAEGEAGRLWRDVCAEVVDVRQLLLTGTTRAIAEFERYVQAADPLVARRIVGVQRIDKPTNRTLSILACWHFTRPRDPCPASA